MKPLWTVPYRKNHWDKWDNWDTRRKPAWLSGIARPIYALVTGTQLGQVGHFGIRTFQDGAAFRQGGQTLPTFRRPTSADFSTRGTP